MNVCFIVGENEYWESLHVPYTHTLQQKRRKGFELWKVENNHTQLLGIAVKGNPSQLNPQS